MYFYSTFRTARSLINEKYSHTERMILLKDLNFC